MQGQLHFVAFGRIKFCRLRAVVVTPAAKQSLVTLLAIRTAVHHAFAFEAKLEPIHWLSSTLARNFFFGLACSTTAHTTYVTIIPRTLASHDWRFIFGLGNGFTGCLTKCSGSTRCTMYRAFYLECHRLPCAAVCSTGCAMHGAFTLCATGCPMLCARRRS